MTTAIAAAATEAATGRVATEATLAAAGMSSAAWLVSTADGEVIVRVPVPDSGRRLTYRTEATIGALLADRGLPVAQWTVVDVERLPCSVAPRLNGRPVVDKQWSRALAKDVASVLLATHHLPYQGVGPLAEPDAVPGAPDAAPSLAGISSDLVGGICDRWFLATIWPFDRTELADHSIADLAPGLIKAVADLRADIAAAGVQGPIGVCHSDLHAEHILVDEHGRLGGLLDFGDAFIGAVAWDFALLLHYYGEANTQTVLRHYDASTSPELMTQARLLAIAVALYKVAKNPSSFTPDRAEALTTLLKATERHS